MPRPKSEVKLMKTNTDILIKQTPAYFYVCSPMKDNVQISLGDFHISSLVVLSVSLVIIVMSKVMTDACCGAQNLS